MNVIKTHRHEVFNNMSYNNISNMLVDGLVLSNKPLSTIEIIDSAKKLSTYGFRGEFLRVFLENQTK